MKYSLVFVGILDGISNVLLLGLLVLLLLGTGIVICHVLLGLFFFLKDAIERRRSS